MKNAGEMGKGIVVVPRETACVYPGVDAGVGRHGVAMAYRVLVLMALPLLDVSFFFHNVQVGRSAWMVSLLGREGEASPFPDRVAVARVFANSTKHSEVWC